jgi:hypothetical protein
MIPTIDYKKLKSRCISPIENFWGEFPENVRGTDGERHIYINNDSPVLSVAHVDTVFKKCKDFIVYPVGGEKYIFSPNLDDRLGVYTVLDFLPSMGISTDVLLTENEEMGLTTAYDFQPDKKYNWVVEFDRMGKSPVLYKFDNPKIRESLKSVGLYPASGTYSDISEMGGLGCTCINWGIGYTEQHTNLCKFKELDYIETMKKFIRFFQQYKNTQFPHIEKFQKSPRWERDTIYRDDWDVFPPSGTTGKMKWKKSGKKSYNFRDGEILTCLWCFDDSPEVEYYPEYDSNLCPTCVNFWDRNGGTGIQRNG